MPKQFELTYMGEDNREHRPVMIHRALMGSFERFIGILIEHYGGEFPLWLAPVQALVLPIADRHIEYAREVSGRLEEAGIRADVDERTESIGKKIRDGELHKVPYMLIVGDQEQSDGTVAVRRHREGDLGATPVNDFIGSLSAAILARE
jgi:threonyl-tRNA synthetase